MNRHDGSRDEVRAPLVQPYQPREGMLIAPARKIGQLAFLIRNTNLGGRLLKARGKPCLDEVSYLPEIRLGAALCWESPV